MVLSIDVPADVLRRLEAEANRRGITVDALGAELMAESAVRFPTDTISEEAVPGEHDEFYGFVPFPKRGSRVTNRLIDQLRDEFTA